MKKILKWVGIALLVILVGIQFIPLSRTNQPVTQAVKWNAPETRALAKRACFDCHSNETVWPWYAYLAPVSLQVVSHVNEGRSRLNFSQWDQPNANLDEIVKVLDHNEMPLWDYLLMHPEAKLTDVEKTALLDGFKATFAQDPPIARAERRP